MHKILQDLRFAFPSDQGQVVHAGCDCRGRARHRRQQRCVDENLTAEVDPVTTLRRQRGLSIALPDRSTEGGHEETCERPWLFLPHPG